MTTALQVLVILAVIVVCVWAGVLIGLHARFGPVRRPRPTPRAAHRAPHVEVRPTVRHEPDPAIRLPALDVVYQPGVTVLPAVGGDATYEQADPTRVDLLAEHVERARRWRQ